MAEGILLHILLTNDDGVFAPGIRALRKALSHEDNFDVLTVAPERERSATSHAITLHKPLHVKEVDLEDEGRGPVWSVNGTPADCTKLGILALAEDRPDLVISGINRGLNLGMDVLYSGTVSAAIEGFLMGVPAIAVSYETDDDRADFSMPAELVVRLVKKMEQKGLARPMLLNVNIPNSLQLTEQIPHAVTTIGMRYYKSVFEPRQDPLGRTYYWLAGEAYNEDTNPETDVGAIRSGYVSITPMQFQLVDDQLMKKMATWDNLF